LIGVGWSLVILTFLLKRRQALDLRGHMSLEIIMAHIFRTRSVFLSQYSLEGVTQVLY